MQKSLGKSSVALLKRRWSDLKNVLNLWLWIMQKSLSKSSVALLKRRGSDLENALDLGL